MSNARIDEFIAIDGNDALRCARELARQEGLFVGITSGATFAGASQVAERAPGGSTILCMLPDPGERYEIPYDSVSLDSVEYQRNNRGGALRAALREHTGWNTLPLVFIGSQFVGGCTDVFDESVNGRLKERLQAQHIGLKEEITNPYDFLPKWLQRRGA